MATTGVGTALVTGASSGLGLEMARLLAERGYTMALTARSAPALETLAGELRSVHGVETLVVPADLAEPGAVPKVIDALGGRPVDVLVNNAGFGGAGAFAETELGTELAMIAVNVTALTHLTKLVLPGMVARRRGRVLNVASTAAFQPGPFMAVYYATKAYVLSFSEALAEELAGSGVTVTTLCPGPTRTAFAERAGMTESRLFRRGVVMDARTVARAGVEGMLRGERLVIPGGVNKVLLQALRVSPRRLTTKITRALNEGRTGADGSGRGRKVGAPGERREGRERREGKSGSAQRSQKAQRTQRSHPEVAERSKGSGRPRIR